MRYLHLLVLLLYGCSGVPVGEPDVVPLTSEPVWSEEAFRQHLRVLGSEALGGRMTGTRGYLQAAGYVEAQWRLALLQPVTETSFKRLYPVQVRVPRRIRVQMSARDSLFFVPGLEVMPDPGTGGGTRVARQLTTLRDSSLTLSGAAVMVPDSAFHEGMAAEVAARGGEVMLVVGELWPGVRGMPEAPLPIVRIRPEAAMRLAGLSRDGLLRWMQGTKRRRLFADLVVTVEHEASPYVWGLNLLGFVAGQHPVPARELVIVCAHLDGPGQPAGVRVYDPTRSGAAAAAVIELARRFSSMAHWTDLPERTILFALWSGSTFDHAGLRAYLQAPSWPLDRTRSVIYLGLERDEVAAVRALLAPYDVPLEAVVVPDSLYETRRPVLVPEPAWLAYARRYRPDLPRPEPPDDDLALEHAVQRALYLARVGERLLLRESEAYDPLWSRPPAESPPVRADTTLNRTR